MKLSELKQKYNDAIDGLVEEYGDIDVECEILAEISFIPGEVKRVIINDSLAEKHREIANME